MDAAMSKALELYGPGIASFLNHPEIGQVIRDAAERGEVADVVIGRLKTTQWWQRTSDSARQWDILAAEDPAEVERRIAGGTTTLTAAASSLGITLNAEQARQIATDTLRYGWSEEEARLVLVNQHDWDTAQAAAPGQMGEAIRRARGLAAEYMVPIGDEALNGLARNWMSGFLDEAGVRSFMEQSARQRWGGNAQIMRGLDQGHTVAQIIDPLKQRIAQTLETSAESIDMTDSYWSQALAHTVDGETRMMNDYEVMQLARKHTDFDATGIAISQANEFADSIVRTFGGRG